MELTHVDGAGAARMVDVTGKEATARSAVATGVLRTTAEVVELLRRDGLPKGDALATARIAGIMAAKRTHELIPLCHPLLLTKVTVDLQPEPSLPGIRVEATVGVAGQTGVEMEALTAVTVACLTLYDMLKAADRGMTIEGVRLLGKSGGASGDWTAP